MRPLNLLIESGELRPAFGRLPVFGEFAEFAADSAGADAVVADRDAQDRLAVLARAAGTPAVTPV